MLLYPQKLYMLINYSWHVTFPVCSLKKVKLLQFSYLHDTHQLVTAGAIIWWAFTTRNTPVHRGPLSHAFPRICWHCKNCSFICFVACKLRYTGFIKELLNTNCSHLKEDTKQFNYKSSNGPSTSTGNNYLFSCTNLQRNILLGPFITR